MTTEPSEGTIFKNDQRPEEPKCARRLGPLFALGLAVAGIALLAFSLKPSYAENGEESTNAFDHEPAIVRQLNAFKKESGPLVSPDDLGQGAHHFTASKQGLSLNGAVWVEGDQVVVDAVISTENQSFVPQRMKAWTADGRAMDSQIQLPPPQAASSDPSEPPVNFNIGFGVSRSVRRHRHSSSESSSHQKSQSQQECVDCTGSYNEPTSSEHHEPHEEHGSSRIYPRVGISFSPTALGQAQNTPPPNQHRFPAPPCPRRLKGWSVGTTVPTTTGGHIPLVAFLDEPPGAFARTAPCQILVVMTLPPGDKGAKGTMRELARSQGLRFLRSFSLSSINTLVALMEVSGTTPLDNIIPTLEAHPDVSYAQDNNLFMTAAYNDPLAEMQYGPRLIEAVKAHQVATGEAVTVAIIDTGIDGDQTDLKGKVFEQVDLIGSDGGGIAGIHGTLMSGVISATENNGVGGYGVAPHVKLLGLKACQPLPENPVEAACTSESIARALDEAIRRKVRLVNMSLGGPPDRLIEALVMKAAEEEMIIVAAAGNLGPKAPPLYPAAYEPVLAVSAVDFEDGRYGQANVGSYVDLAAPGVDIISTLPGDRFNVFSGTSIATAHVTAVAALLLQAKPTLTLSEVTEALQSSAVDLGRRGRDPEFGAGRINACRAMERVTGKSICP